MRKKGLVLTLASWNVRTLLDNIRADRPERRTALVARELARYKVDIAALSETRFSDKGQLTESGGGYTFFWSGRSSEERREAGVGFAIKTEHVKKLASIPEGINDRLMKMQLPLSKGRTATLISTYAPTMTNPEDIKDKFYEDLECLIAAAPKREKLIVLGDFNARVGTDHSTWDRVLGRHGVGKCNSNGLRLLSLCTAHDLTITNTMFRLPTRSKTSWMHPRSRHWHLIDYVIVRARDRRDVRLTKAVCGADCWTDHRLIISKMCLNIQPKRRPQGKKVTKRLDVEKLKSPDVIHEFQEAINNKLSVPPTTLDTIEDQWAYFRDSTYSIALEIIGPKKKKHQDWFDENDSEIQPLLEEKRQLLRAHQSDPKSVAKKAAFINIRSKVQARLRSMQDAWLSAKADEIQEHADNHDVRKFYDALKAVYGPQSSGSSPLLSSDGTTLLNDKKRILDRWAEHFNSVLNRPSSINDEAIDRLPQEPIKEELNIPPSSEEVSKAIKQLSSGKAPGPDSIPAEVYKSGGPTLLTRLTELFQSMWEREQLPQEFRDATIIHIYKRKGDRRSCDNHRGISLLSIAGKILARVLLNRLLVLLEDGLCLPESQSGFRVGRGTTDMIFAARQLQEKCVEQHRGLYTAFVDLTKAFDTVSRNGLWRIMGKFGCPDRFIAIVRQFHEGMTARVLDDGDPSEPFPVTNGVKQGCVLAPTLFSMVFSAMLQDAFKDSHSGINIKYRCDGKLLNIRRMQAVTKVKETIIRDLLFADDCALNAPNETEMQHQINRFSTGCDNFGLTISTKKTEVMYQPAPGDAYHEPCITVKGQKLHAVEQFTYLGSTLSRTANNDIEVNHRISKASSAFGRLRDNVWERRGITLTTKLKVYRAVVLTTLLYGCETWTPYKRHEKQLNGFHLRCLRNVLNIRWQDRIPDTEVLERAGLQTITTIIRKAQLRWAGHVSRMPDSRIPKQLLYGELSQGKRTAGGQKKRFKDSLKTALKDFDINPQSWESLAAERSAWRCAISLGARKAEEQRMTHARQKRERRKERTASAQPADPAFTCPECGRVCRARIGLTSHLRTHLPRAPD